MSVRDEDFDLGQHKGNLWRPFILALLVNLDIEGLSVKFDVDNHTYTEDNIIGYQHGREVHLLPKRHSFWKKSYDPNALMFTVFAHECFHVHQWKRALQEGVFEKGSNITSDWINTEAGIQFAGLRNKLNFDIFIFEDHDEVECAALFFEVRIGVGVLAKIGRDFSVMISDNEAKDGFIREVSFLLYYFGNWFEEHYPRLGELYPVPEKWQLREL